MDTLKEAAKHVLTINAVAGDIFCTDVNSEVGKLKVMNNAELEEKLIHLKRLLRLVTTCPRLAAPTQESVEMAEYIESMKKKHGSFENFLEWRKNNA